MRQYSEKANLKPVLGKKKNCTEQIFPEMEKATIGAIIKERFPSLGVTGAQVRWPQDSGP